MEDNPQQFQDKNGGHGVDRAWWEDIQNVQAKYNMYSFACNWKWLDAIYLGRCKTDMFGWKRSIIPLQPPKCHLWIGIKQDDGNQEGSKVPQQNL